MGKNSGIEWTTHTLNFWIGCQEVSAACDFCYAREQNKFRGWVDGWGPHGERRRTKTWNDARRWNREAREAGRRDKVFSNSLSDFFDKAVDDTGIRDEAWQMIDECRDLDWLLLTKRPQLIVNRLPPGWKQGWPHVWLGTTVENQEEADRRIPHLLAVPAKVHFLSCEPLLGPVDLPCYLEPPAPLTAVTWVIAGGESGPGARPSHPDWFRSLRDQCAAAGVPWFFKQWGGFCPYEMDQTGDGFWLDPNGHTYGGPTNWPPKKDEPRVFMKRVGKKAAGSLLDGLSHKAMPA